MTSAPGAANCLKAAASDDSWFSSRKISTTTTFAPSESNRFTFDFPIVPIPPKIMAVLPGNLFFAWVVSGASDIGKSRCYKGQGA